MRNELFLAQESVITVWRLAGQCPTMAPNMSVVKQHGSNMAKMAGMQRTQAPLPPRRNQDGGA